MPAASRSTRRVRYVNVNSAAGNDGDDGRFELLVVTEDEERHTVAPGPPGAATLIALTQASPVLLWDADNRTLIGANVVGDWLPLDWSGADRG